jgi:hypothetical protein
MLHTLLSGKRGVFFKNATGDIVGWHIYDSNSNSPPPYEQKGLVDGSPVKGYAGSDMGVRLLVVHAEEVMKV